MPVNPVAVQFGNNLAYCRERANISQEELGYRASLHRTEISLLERGARVPRVDTLIKLTGSLSVEPDELLDGIDWAPGSLMRGKWATTPSEPR